MEGRLRAFRAALYGQRTLAGKGTEKAFPEREWHLQRGEAQHAGPKLGAGKQLSLRVCLAGRRDKEGEKAPEKWLGHWMEKNK